eukprot:Opistho-2@6923
MAEESARQGPIPPLGGWTLDSLPDDALHCIFQFENDKTERLLASDLDAVSRTCRRLRLVCEEEARRRVAKLWKGMAECTDYENGAPYPTLAPVANPFCGPPSTVPDVFSAETRGFDKKVFGTWLFSDRMRPIKRPTDSWICVLSREEFADGTVSLAKDDARFQVHLKRTYEAFIAGPWWATLTDEEKDALTHYTQHSRVCGRVYIPHLLDVECEYNEYTTTAEISIDKGNGTKNQLFEIHVGEKMKDDSQADLQDTSQYLTVPRCKFITYRASFFRSQINMWSQTWENVRKRRGPKPLSYRAFLLLVRLCVEAVGALDAELDNGSSWALLNECAYRDSVLVARLTEIIKVLASSGSRPPSQFDEDRVMSRVKKVATGRLIKSRNFNYGLSGWPIRQAVSRVLGSIDSELTTA